MRAQEFDLRLRRQVEQQRVLPAIKLLRERAQRLGAPGGAVGWSRKC